MPTSGFTFNRSFVPLIDGVLWGSGWSPSDPPTTYAIASAAEINTNNFGGYAGFQGPANFNASQAAAAHKAIANINAVCGLAIVETQNVAQGNIRFGAVRQFDANDTRGMHTPGGVTAEAMIPSFGFQPNGDGGLLRYPAYTHGDTWYNPDFELYPNARPGTFAFAAAFLHEPGHAVGLKHGHVSQPENGVTYPALPAEFDSQEFSVMTYKRFVGDVIDNQQRSDLRIGDYPTTYMMADIMALQYMYGADFTTNAGNTVYKWNPSTGEMSINGAAQGRPIRNKVFLTIWDGNGTDTYDMSNYSTPVNIDLAPGSFSITSQAQRADLDGASGSRLARGNVFNAQIFNGDVRSRIENANGGAGNDTIKGNTGNNVLDGRGGADTLTGLTGNDTFIVDNAGDKVIEVGSSGVDTVRTSVSYTLGASANVEVLTTLGVTTTTAINLTGNSQVNSLIGNAAANLLDGKGGADTISGAKGNDRYVIDNAGDRIIEAAGQGTDSASTTASYTLGLGVSVETLTALGNGALSLTGNQFANTLVGNAAGNTLNGGTGIDTMSGLAGNDTYIVDNSSDVVIEGNGRGTDNIRTSVSYVLKAGVSVETLQTQNPGTAIVLSLTGNSFANTILGNKANNTINGGGGADRMQGFTGNDLYFIDNAGDTVIEAAGGGIDRVSSSITLTLAANVENLTLTGSSALNGTGNSLNNTIVGNAAANTLNSATGNDSLDGGAGNDVLIGGPGKETLKGGTGDDRFDFNVAAEIGNGTSRDVITDFNTAGTVEKIDLSTVDANGSLAGDTAFTFRPAAGSAFTGAAGQLRWFQENLGGLPTIKPSSKATRTAIWWPISSSSLPAEDAVGGRFYPVAALARCPSGAGRLIVRAQVSGARALSDLSREVRFRVYGLWPELDGSRRSPMERASAPATRPILCWNCNTSILSADTARNRPKMQQMMLLSTCPQFLQCC